MTPKEGKQLQTNTDKILGVERFDKAVHGTDLGSKFARGVVHAAKDVLTDPATFLPVGDIAKVAGMGLKSIPTVGKAVEAFAKTVEESGVASKARKVFSSESGQEVLTPHGRAVLQSERNKARSLQQVRSQAGAKAIADHADDLRKGVIHPDVEAHFNRAEANRFRLPEEEPLGPVPGKPLEPQQLKKDLDMALSRQMRTSIWENSADRITKEGPDKMFKPGTSHEARSLAIDKALGQSSTTKLGEFEKLIGKGKHAGNKAILTIPMGHMKNIADLAGQRYGPLAPVAGTYIGTKIALGKVRMPEQLLDEAGKLTVPIESLTEDEKDLLELHRIGAHSLYGNIYNEIGISKLGGSAGAAKLANAVLLKPGQKASNKLQNLFLNPLESGLRVVALRAERKMHPNASPEEWARNIHSAFGTDEANAITRIGSKAGEPFAKFHVQTSVGQGLRTLATNPGRITAPMEAKRDINQQVNPGTEFMAGTPGENSLRFLANPLAYASTLLGPLSTAKASYTALTKAEKDKWAAAVAELVGPEGAGRYIPLDELYRTLWNALHGNKKGKGGEQPTSDIVPDLFGGYFADKK
jgi:hypothetical protein